MNINLFFLRCVQMFAFMGEIIFLCYVFFPGRPRSKDRKHWIMSSLYVFSGLLSIVLLEIWNASYDGNAVYTTITSSVAMTSALIFSFLAFFEFYHGDIITKIFYCFIAFSARNLYIRVFEVFSKVTGLKESHEWLDTILSIVLFIVIFSLFYLLWYRRTKKPDYTKIDRRMFFLFLLIFAPLNTLFGYLEQKFASDRNSYIAFYSVFALIYLLILAYQITILRVTRERVISQTAKTMLEVQEKQFESFRESVNYLNIKCHDLKHQLKAFKNNKPYDKKTIEEIDNSIATFNSFSETPSEALSLVLREKSLLCASKRIEFVTAIESEHLCTLFDGDIYSLFGNIIDNAIEYESNLQENERLIRLKVFERSNFLMIHEENYFKEDSIQLIDGLPKTTKKDKNYHGFGTQSMKLITEKYNGFMKINASEHLFTVDIGIPFK